MKFEYAQGATPLNSEEMLDLLPTHITTQEQLNAWEQKNIVQAELWARKQKFTVSLAFIQKLHEHMFDQTWKWNGKFRKSEKNIGINWHLIATELKKLCDDVNYQIEHKTFSADEIAVRFHHRLVWIHPFPNGNGRHARLMADLLIMQLGHPRFSWGLHQDLYKQSEVRKHYIQALQEADRGNYKPLIAFARS